MAFELAPLPYDYNALEPTIDEETMHLHHDKHHQTYVTNLNKALESAPEFADVPLEELLKRINEVPESIRTAVRNNGGGHSNHTLYWNIMRPESGTEPSGELAEKINSTFGGVDQLKEKINTSGAGRFGSGWAWLIVNKSGELEVISTANQDSPVMDGNHPILGVDVWEHAYYLKYKNVRADYLKAWWTVVNWNEVSRRYEEAEGIVIAGQ